MGSGLFGVAKFSHFYQPKDHSPHYLRFLKRHAGIGGKMGYQ
jgi:hypothetical protein